VVVLKGEGHQEPCQLLGGSLGSLEIEVHVSIGEIRRDQVQALEIGSTNGQVNAPLALDQFLTTTLDLGLDAKIESRGTLWIQIPNQSSGALPGREVCQVDGCRSLTDASFDVVGREVSREL